MPRPSRSPGCGEETAGVGVGQGPIRGRCAGKTTRALGDNLRERGHRAEVDTVTDAAITTLAPQMGVRAACGAVGAAQAGYYRRHRTTPAPVRPAPVRPAPVPHRDRHQPRALTAAERRRVLSRRARTVVRSAVVA